MLQAQICLECLQLRSHLHHASKFCLASYMTHILTAYWLDIHACLTLQVANNPAKADRKDRHSAKTANHNDKAPAKDQK